MARQQARMQVDETVAWDFEQSAGDHLAVRNYYGSIRANFPEPRINLLRLEAVRLQTLDLIATGGFDNRWWCEDLMPSNRPVRSGNNQRDLVPAFHQLLEGGYRKIGGTEEDDFHSA